MNKKISNYIGLCIGVLLTLTILYANDNYRRNSSQNRHDFITYDINETMIYDVFCVRHCRSSSFSSFSSFSGYLFWYILLTIGFWSSWKYRLKTGKMIIKFSKNIHQKIVNE